MSIGILELEFDRPASSTPFDERRLIDLSQKYDSSDQRYQNTKAFKDGFLHQNSVNGGILFLFFNSNR